MTIFAHHPELLDRLQGRAESWERGRSIVHDAEWREEEHRRDAGGRFSTTVGKKASPPQPTPAARATAPAPAPKAPAPKEPPLAKRNAYYEAIEEPPLNEGLEAAEDNWRGGLANLGDPEAAYQIQQMPGYFDYRSHLEDAAREHLGDEFIMYRSLPRDELEDWKGGADMRPVGATFSQSLANKWTGLAAHAGQSEERRDRVVVAIPVTPESIIMRGHESESEIVFDPNEIDARRIKVVGEPEEPAAAPRPAPAPREAEKRYDTPIGRPPAGINMQTHKNLGDYGFRYKGEVGELKLAKYENPNGDSITFKRGPDEEALFWEAEFPDKHYHTSGYGSGAWQFTLKQQRPEYRRIAEQKQQETAARQHEENVSKYPMHFSVIKDMAAKYKYPIDKFRVLDPEGDDRFKSKVNGRPFTVGGWAQHDGNIVISATVLGSLNGLVAHEIMHEKQFAAEKADPAIKQFIDKNFKRLQEDDGLTAYSRDWWANYQKAEAAFEGTYAQKNPESKAVTAVRARADYEAARWSAIGETLAEMAHRKETGNIKFTSSYETLYDMINKAYEKTLEAK